MLFKDEEVEATSCSPQANMVGIDYQCGDITHTVQVMKGSALQLLVKEGCEQFGFEQDSINLW